MARPSQWSEPTKMIRVPVSQAETLLEIARRVDQGIPDDFESELDVAIADVLQTSKIRHNDRIFAGRLFDKLRQRLKNRPEQGG